MLVSCADYSKIMRKDRMTVDDAYVRSVAVGDRYGIGPDGVGG